MDPILGFLLGFGAARCQSVKTARTWCIAGLMTGKCGRKVVGWVTASSWVCRPASIRPGCHSTRNVNSALNGPDAECDVFDWFAWFRARTLRRRARVRNVAVDHYTTIRALIYTGDDSQTTWTGRPSPPMNSILGFLRRAASQKLPPLRRPLHRAMDELQIIAEDTISRTPEIIAATPGASADSTFHANQLPPLTKDACPNFPPFTVRIEGLDAFTTAREYIQIDPTIRGKVAILNLASDLYRAGGWRDTLCKTQVRVIVIL